MSNRKLFHIIGQIDDDLIEEAEKEHKQPKKNMIWLRWGALAACFALIISAAVILPRLNGSAPGESASDTQAGLTNDESSTLLTVGNPASTMSVTATKIEDDLISTDSGFIISGSGLSLETVQNQVQITPETDFTVAELSSNGYLITPTTEIVSNALVNVAFTDADGEIIKKWAFQTADVFRITGTYPAEGDWVETSTGVEISFSTDKTDLNSFKAAFSIKPAVDGSFEQRGKTVVFVPTDGLTPGASYTVNLDGSAADTEGTAIGEGVSFRFTVNSDYSNFSVFFSAQYQVDTFTCSDAPIAEMDIDAAYHDKNVNTAVYAFDNFEGFKDALCKSADGDYEADISAMTKITEFTCGQVISPSGNTSYSYITYPEAVAEGMYMAVYTIEADGETHSLYRFMQVTDISVYCANGGNQMFVWLNDAARGKPLEGAEVTVIDGEKEKTVKTDANGTAICGISGENTCLVSAADGTRYFAALISGGGEAYEIANDPDYYGYIYTNREMYLPTDTISVWGCIFPRKSGVAAPETVTVSFGEAMSSQVEVEKNGSFTCQFNIVDMAATYTTVTVSAGNGAVAGHNIAVNEYKKPVYVVDAQTDKDIYFADEMKNVNVTVQTSFYDGTPAEGMPVECQTPYTGDDSSQTVNSDENGHSSFNISFDRSTNNSWTPTGEYISINTNESDSVVTYASQNPTVFYRDVMLSGELTGVGSDRAISVKANHIDLGSIDTVDELYADNYPENIRGAAYDCTVSMKITESYWEDVPTGSYYDFITKKSVETYDSQWVENDLGTVEMHIVGEGMFGDLPKLYDDRNYTFTLTTTDADGYTVEYVVYYSGSDYSFYNNTGDSVSLSFGSEKGEFGAGEDVEISLKNYLKDFTAGQNSYFISYVRQDEFYRPEMHTGSGFTLAYDENNIPNIILAGAYFCDGKVYDIDPLYLSFEYKDRELTVDITPEQEHYEPGQTAGATVKVTDKNGDPVARAALCVSVSDEAAFAVQAQDVTVASDIYGYRFWGYLGTYVSYKQIDAMPDMMAEMGGEGAGDLRKKFSDDLTFVNLVTDEKGEADVSFDLADNLTSWRITAIAEKDGFAGSRKANIKAGLPMYILPTMSGTYLTGDDIAFGCRTYGTEIAAGDEVQYTVEICTADGTTVSAIEGGGGYVTGRAGSTSFFSFGKMNAGSYLLRLTGKSGEYSDGVELPFTVVDTAAELWLTGDIDIAEAGSLEPTKYPVMLSFSNKAYEVYNEVLNSVYASGSGSRTDRTAALAFAQSLMAELTGDETYLENSPSLVELKNKYGFVSELSAGTGSAYFSARMAAAFPDSVNRNELIRQFGEILDNFSASTEEITSAYMGLAAFGQPVLSQLRSFWTDNRDALDETDVMRVAAAFALMGDYDSSEKLFDSYAVPKQETLTLNDGTEYLRYVKSSTEEENVELTALASVTADILGLEQADGLARYLIYAKDSLSASEKAEFYPLCELVCYLRYFDPTEFEEAAVSCIIDGKTMTYELGRRGVTTVTFNSAEEYRAANVKAVSGIPMVTATYMGSLNQVEDYKSDYLSVKKIIDGTAAIGQELTVTIEVTAAKPGFICIEDYIPSGFRLADDVSYVDGQTVGFWLENGKTVTYKIKPVVPGTFIVESPVASRIDNGLLVTGQRSEITVTNG